MVQKKLTTSTLIKDIGYWDFSETGVNSVEGGMTGPSQVTNMIKMLTYMMEYWMCHTFPTGEGWGVTSSVDLKPR